MEGTQGERSANTPPPRAHAIEHWSDMNPLKQSVLNDRTRRLTADLGLLVLRVAVGAIFIAHGWGDASQEGGAGANIENYRGAGIPLPELSAWFGAYMQLLGGAAVLLGALTRLAGAGLAIVMAGALIFVHPGEPLVMGQDGSGSGFALIMLAASIALACTGAGRLSIEEIITPRRQETGPNWGGRQKATRRDLDSRKR